MMVKVLAGTARPPDVMELALPQWALSPSPAEAEAAAPDSCARQGWRRRARTRDTGKKRKFRKHTKDDSGTRFEPELRHG